MKYDIEISGSVTAKRTAANLNDLREIANRAQGRVSVVVGNREVFHGAGRDLVSQIDLATEMEIDTI